MKKITWTLEPYQDDEGNWVPKVTMQVESDGKTTDVPLSSPDFAYEEKEDAERHAEYLAKDYEAANR